MKMYNRYWNCCWSVVYVTLLNDHSLIGLERVIGEVKKALNTFGDAKRKVQKHYLFLINSLENHFQVAMEKLSQKLINHCGKKFRGK